MNLERINIISIVHLNGIYISNDDIDELVRKFKPDERRSVNIYPFILEHTNDFIDFVAEELSLRDA